ncbi:MAG TPA: DUF1934 domain-containing protein [Candidatus Limnocylindria bacterium]|nr:DUF1934 domain-containing protein [Candidatus Limnocylindria bacterium]
MKNKPVKLTVTGVAHNRNEDDEAMRLTTFGTLSGSPKLWKLRYTERQADSSEKHDITMTMGDGVVTVARKGTFNSDLVFQEGRRYEGSYHTPFGDLAMGIFPTKVDYSVQDGRGGEVSLRYQLDIQGRYTSVHNLDIAFEFNNPNPRA